MIHMILVSETKVPGVIEPDQTLRCWKRQRRWRTL